MDNAHCLLTDCECNIHKQCVDGVTELCSKKKKDKRQSMIGKIIRKQTINNPSESPTDISRECFLRRPVSIISCFMRGRIACEQLMCPLFH